MKEEVVELNVKDICDFPKHPFKINNDLNYEELKNSIIESGVLVPTIVRKKEDGKYEMLSGHRRKKICEEQGIKKIPCIVKDISDEEAIGESREQIRRYIRLNNLIPELLQLVDDTVLKDKRSALTMGLRPAVELSYLSKDDQELVYEEITYEDLTPSHVQAKRIRELGEKGELDSDILESIFLEQKPNQAKRLSFNEERIRKVLPKDIKDYKIEDFIIKAIESYSKTLSNERGDSYDLDI